MSETQIEDVDGDAMQLRFVGKNDDGSDLHELRAAHVAEVLQGVVGISSDFAKAGAFGDGPPTDVYVRPAQEGSFIIEVVRAIQDNPEMVGTTAVAAIGGPSLSQVIWWATKAARADVRDFEYLENGNVRVEWQDDTSYEITKTAWAELNKNDRRRKKHLRQILAPLSDPRVTKVEVTDDEDVPDETPLPESAPREFSLNRDDYNAVNPEDEIEESQRFFVTEAQMAAIDFEAADKWRVRTKDANRTAAVEDKEFLGRVNGGLALHKDDIFELKIREDKTVKNGRTATKWFVLEVKSHRRSVSDDDA